MSRLTRKKGELRKTALTKRKAIQSAELSAQAANHLIAALEPYRGKVIAGYMPIRSEIDPVVAMEAISAHARVVVPVIQGEGLPLIFREWTPDCEMLEGPYGALVPAQGDFLEPDVLIVPLVAFDKKGGRLGYGGGYYDRTLEQLNASRPRVAIGYAFSGQEFDKVPREKTDFLLDSVVTENGVVTF